MKLHEGDEESVDDDTCILGIDAIDDDMYAACETRVSGRRPNPARRIGRRVWTPAGSLGRICCTY
jgi:hypothetical protein